MSIIRILSVRPRRQQRSHKALHLTPESGFWVGRVETHPNGVTSIGRGVPAGKGQEEAEESGKGRGEDKPRRTAEGAFGEGADGGGVGPRGVFVVVPFSLALASLGVGCFADEFEGVEGADEACEERWCGRMVKTSGPPSYEKERATNRIWGRQSDPGLLLEG